MRFIGGDVTYGAFDMSNDPQKTKPSVLLVDDNEVHRYALDKALQHAEFEVLTAHTGTQALDLAEKHIPDVLLLDINLPDVNGFEVCARLKTNPQTEAIPVVFHSATSATAAAQSYAQSLGAAAFLTYPIDTNHLVVILQGTIARSK